MWLLLTVHAQADLGIGWMVAAMLDGIAKRLASDERCMAKQVAKPRPIECVQMATQQVFHRGLYLRECLIAWTDGEDRAAGNQDLRLSLGVTREAELGVVFEAAQKNAIEDVVEDVRRSGPECRGVRVDVVLKVTAKQPGLVPGKAARRARLQKKPCRFEGSHGKDVPASAEDRFLSAEGAAANASADAVFQEELDGIGMQPDLDAGIVFERAAVQPGKVGLRAPAGHIKLEIVQGRGTYPECLPDLSVVQHGSAHTLKLQGAGVIRGELAFAEGPAAAGDPGVRLEVGLFELQDLASPLGRGAAVHARSTHVHSAMRQPGQFGAKEILGSGFGVSAAAFQ